MCLRNVATLPKLCGRKGYMKTREPLKGKKKGETMRPSVG